MKKFVNILCILMITISGCGPLISGYRQEQVRNERLNTIPAGDRERVLSRFNKKINKPNTTRNEWLIPEKKEDLEAIFDSSHEEVKREKVRMAYYRFCDGLWASQELLLRDAGKSWQIVQDCKKRLLQGLSTKKEEQERLKQYKAERSEERLKNATTERRAEESLRASRLRAYKEKRNRNLASLCYDDPTPVLCRQTMAEVAAQEDKLLEGVSSEALDRMLRNMGQFPY